MMSPVTRLDTEGSAHCSSEPTTPMISPMPTASGRLRSLAATTAANADAVMTV